MAAIVIVIFASIAEGWYLNLNDFLGAWAHGVLVKEKVPIQILPS